MQRYYGCNTGQTRASWTEWRDEEFKRQERMLKKGKIDSVSYMFWDKSDERKHYYHCVSRGPYNFLYS